jgi:hypothetical protein
MIICHSEKGANRPDRYLRHLPLWHMRLLIGMFQRYYAII